MLKAHLGKTHPEWDAERLGKEVAKRFIMGPYRTDRLGLSEIWKVINDRIRGNA